jgi:hypothetical protein
MLQGYILALLSPFESTFQLHSLASIRKLFYFCISK